MRKEEKTRISRERILQAAIREFGKNSYDSGSMNSICIDNGLSKGLIYHNFKNKEDLYLCALKRCIEELSGYISREDYEGKETKEKVLGIQKKRKEFFNDNPSLRNLFFYSVYEPPKNLAKEVEEIQREYFDTIASLFSTSRFREGKGLEFLCDYFVLSASMIACYTKSKLPEKTEIGVIEEEHEKNLSLFIDVLLFGILEE